jgi:hypothetical protein
MRQCCKQQSYRGFESDALRCADCDDLYSYNEHAKTPEKRHILTSQGPRGNGSCAPKEAILPVCSGFFSEPDVVNSIGEYTLVSVNTQKAIVPFWVRSTDLDCRAAAGPSAGQSITPPAHDRTKDGYVWKEGKRIGWVDSSETFYRLDQLVDGRSTSPSAKAGVKGRKVTGTLDFSVLEAQQETAKPPGAALERTGDGFVWRDGQRIGWVDTTASIFYRLDQLDLAKDRPPSPKSGQAGAVIEANNLSDAVSRALP